MKDPDKLKLMLLAWNYNLQQVHAQAQAQAANAALSPNNSSTTTSTTVGTPVTSQSAISTANNTISNSTLTGNTLSHPASDRDRESRRCDSWKIRLAALSFISLRVRTQGRVASLNEVDSSSIFCIFQSYSSSFRPPSRAVSPSISRNFYREDTFILADT